MQTELWIWGIVTLAVFAPIAWVRMVEKFKVGYIYAVCTIFLMIVVVGTFVCMKIYEDDNEAGDATPQSCALGNIYEQDWLYSR